MEKDYIKEQIKREIEGCISFDDILDKIAEYIIKYYGEREIINE